MEKNTDFRVAGYQMPVTENVQENVQRIFETVDRASDAGAEILLTPEGSLSGYTHQFDAAEVRAALKAVTERARVKKVGLALGSCFVEEDGKCYNEIRFYTPGGDYLGFHSKTLCCGSLDAPSQGELNHYAVSKLSVFPWREGVVVGGLICNDLWANPGCTPMPDPHLSQQLSRKGAQVIFHAINGGRNGSSMSELAWQYHESNLRMRALAGRIWIVTADNCTPEHIPCSAPSGVIDPSGSFVCRAEAKGEQFFLYTIPLGQEKDTSSIDAADHARKASP